MSSKILHNPVMLAVSGVFRRQKKVLILDMDWYRFCLNEEEVRTYLYKNPAFRGKVIFKRIPREQIFRPEANLTLEVDKENYKDVCYKGYNLWGISKATLASYLAATSPDFSNPAHREEVIRIYRQASLGIDNLKDLFLELKPDGVFIFQGGVFDSRCVVEVSRDLGINVIGIENSMIGGLVILDNLTGQIINRYSLAYTGTQMLETLEISPRQRQEVFSLWQEKLSSKVSDHKTGGLDTVSEINAALKIPPGLKLLLLLAQVRTDASVILDSPLFPDPVDMIEQVCLCARDFKDTLVLVRLHPKELKGHSLNRIPYNSSTFRALKERGIDRLPNVLIIEETKFNTYTLMQMAHAGITLNSQAGLEMCLLAKPVMVCGRAFYGQNGFTVDLAHLSAFKSTLDFLVHKAVFTQTEHKLALNFFYLYYHRHLFDHRLKLHPQRLRQIFMAKPDYEG